MQIANGTSSFYVNERGKPAYLSTTHLTISSIPSCKVRSLTEGLWIWNSKNQIKFQGIKQKKLELDGVAHLSFFSSAMKWSSFYSICCNQLIN